MRMIDADALVIDYYDDYETKDDEYTYAYVSEAQIYSAPSIDIVRCKECRHRNERCGMGEHRWCESLNMSTTPDDFCSYGERKSDD